MPPEPPREFVVRLVIEVIGAGIPAEIPLRLTDSCDSPVGVLPTQNALRLAEDSPLAPTLPPAVNAWANELRRLRRSAAYQKDGPALVRKMAARFGWNHPQDATSAQIQAWIAEQGWKGCTQNNALAMLSTFFAFACKPLKLRRDNPVDEIERAESQKGDGVREFTPAETSRIIAAASGHWITACTLMAMTLLRRGAVFRGPRAVRCGYFDRAGRCLDVPRGVLKNGKAQTIPLNDDAMAVLVKATEGRKATDFIVPVRFDDEIWIALLKRAKVSRYDERGRPAGTHSFRKGGATAMAEAGVHPQTAQHLLGHSDIRLTMQSYTRMGYRHQVEAVKILGSVNHDGTETCAQTEGEGSKIIPDGGELGSTNRPGRSDTDAATTVVHTLNNSAKPPAPAPGHCGSTFDPTRAAGSAEFSRADSQAGEPFPAPPATSQNSPTRTRTLTGGEGAGNQARVGSSTDGKSRVEDQSGLPGLRGGADVHRGGVAQGEETGQADDLLGQVWQPNAHAGRGVIHGPEVAAHQGQRPAQHADQAGTPDAAGPLLEVRPDLQAGCPPQGLLETPGCNVALPLVPHGGDVEGSPRETAPVFTDLERALLRRLLPYLALAGLILGAVYAAPRIVRAVHRIADSIREDGR